MGFFAALSAFTFLFWLFLFFLFAFLPDFAIVLIRYCPEKISWYYVKKHLKEIGESMWFGRIIHVMVHEKCFYNLENLANMDYNIFFRDGLEYTNEADNTTCKLFKKYYKFEEHSFRNYVIIENNYRLINYIPNLKIQNYEREMFGTWRFIYENFELAQKYCRYRQYKLEYFLYYKTLKNVNTALDIFLAHYNLPIKRDRRFFSKFPQRQKMYFKLVYYDPDVVHTKFGVVLKFGKNCMEKANIHYNDWYKVFSSFE